ncbi:Transcriptional regulator [Tenacibaculum maritimum]|uniref:GyrI-like domain-containing protein n=1 Tax=Tenacibaculum maritimum TaxID=107401 RepID=UPI0012E6C17D|nr:GyrI-like domain-containing protein [Tenacibaculum maritimum]CAA0190302.1 Transcriptional regulator [Tenacibaculum maritimum]
MTNGFKIIGIATRTTNKDNKSQKDLEQLWRQFYSENILEKVSNKISNEIISIYTDYKNDYTEDYTTIIGIPVSTLNEIPNGLIGREFQSENFKKFVAKGEMPNAVVDTWIEIWKKDKELNRKYTYDFEVYGENSQKGKNSEVEIYISVE